MLTNNNQSLWGAGDLGEMRERGETREKYCYLVPLVYLVPYGVRAKLKYEDSKNFYYFFEDGRKMIPNNPVMPRSKRRNDISK